MKELFFQKKTIMIFFTLVDGAVVERGKPHLVQDAAVQVSISGRSYRSLLAGQQRYNQKLVSTFDRRRRHSWHDVNEYHSVPYYQYTCFIRSGSHKAVQCNLDDERSKGTQEFLSHISEETIDEHQLHYMEEHTARETVHNQSIPQNRVHISIMTQTEYELDFDLNKNKTILFFKKSIC